MKILGITGGIGCGKSLILNELHDKYGAYIIETDSLAHKLMSKDMPIYKAVVNAFGTYILDEAGNIDRNKLGKIVFNDKTKLELLNSLSHPLVKEYIVNDIAEKKKTNEITLYVIEAALLIQDGYKAICDEIWYIWASEEVRTKRLMEYRGYTLEKCKAVIASQDNEEYYKKYTNYTIDNDNSIKNSTKQLNELLNNFLKNDIIA